MKWYRKYCLEAHYEVSQWFKSGAWWLVPAAWVLVVAPPTFLLYFLFQCCLFMVFLPFFLASRTRMLVSAIGRCCGQIPLDLVPNTYACKRKGGTETEAHAVLRPRFVSRWEMIKAVWRGEYRG